MRMHAVRLCYLPNNSKSQRFMTLFDLICIFPRQMFLHLNDLLARYHFLAPLYILILCSHGFISPKSAKTLSSSQKRRRFKKVAAAFDSVFKSSTAAASQLERARSSQGSGKSARALSCVFSALNGETRRQRPLKTEKPAELWRTLQRQFSLVVS